MTETAGQGTLTGRPGPAMTALAIASFVAYLPALSAGFTADDFFILHRVEAARGLSHPLEYFNSGFFGYFRPLAFLSHALDWHWWGTNAFGFHLTNVLLHAANTLLVFLVGRRLLSGWGPTLAGLLFALHPASHEAVYWVAARFDLLATGFSLAAIWCLAGDRPARRLAGFAAFAMGLLSKESAIAVLMIAPAWDVLVARRSLAASGRRLLPLLFVVAAYVVVRAMAADVDTTGGDRRLPKMLMTGAAVVAIFITGWWRGQELARRPVPHAPLFSWRIAVGAGSCLVALCLIPATFPFVAEKLGFVAYAAFYALSPVVLPPPAVEWFVPSTPREVVPGLFVALTVIGLAWRYGRTIVQRDEALWLVVLIAAALVPVSSMIGGLRYLYMASAGVALLLAWLLRRVPRAGVVPAAACVLALLSVSSVQIVTAGRAWKQASDTIRDGVTLMTQSVGTCSQTDILLLTAPVGIGGVYSNLYWESFDVLTGCAPRSVMTLLRMVGTASPIEVVDRGDGQLELRIQDYSGNIVASEDLRNFRIPILRGHGATISTPAGTLQTYPQGKDQVFRIALTDQALAAERFLYSSGAIKAVPRRP